MNPAIQTILSGKEDGLSEALQVFLENNAKVFTFSDLNKNNVRSQLWEVLFNYINNDGFLKFYAECLTAIRILSRDKTDLDQLITEERLDLLLKRASLLQLSDSTNENVNYNIAVEALKCLCNVIYNSSVALAICSKNRCLEGIMKRSKQYRDVQMPCDIKIFDMKVLFLITALCEEVRPKLKEEMHGLTYLIEVLEFMVENKDKNTHNLDVNSASRDLSSDNIDLICEVLKVLFNLTVRSDINVEVDEEEEAHYINLISILRRLLLAAGDNSKKTLEMHGHIVNLLTNMPNKCYKQLIVPVQANEDVPKSLQYEEQNMKAIHVILKYLENRFEGDLTVRNQQELLSPALTVLLKGVNSSRVLRKYLRQQVLPPLTDVHNRPEEGATIRNCLCRLLTTPMTNVRDLTADLLFVLCKENVGRMIKYTGYGNAAGLFAQRGLLSGGKPGDTRYSSDSEDSDTEEYREFKHGINPVIGCYEAPHTNPTQHMTEEQKEYEAMKLVNLMDDLARKGIVQPCKIGEDGRPQPIEHVLELQESLPNSQVRRSSDDD